MINRRHKVIDWWMNSSSGSIPSDNWILIGGIWKDSGVWVDSDLWID